MTDDIHHIPNWSGRALVICIVAAYLILVIRIWSTT